MPSEFLHRGLGVLLAGRGSQMLIGWKSTNVLLNAYEQHNHCDPSRYIRCHVPNGSLVHSLSCRTSGIWLLLTPAATLVRASIISYLLQHCRRYLVLPAASSLANYGPFSTQLSEYSFNRLFPSKLEIILCHSSVHGVQWLPI